MLDTVVEYVLSFCVGWLVLVASYSVYLWHNSPRRVLRRKLIETSYLKQNDTRTVLPI